MPVDSSLTPWQLACSANLDAVIRDAVAALLKGSDDRHPCDPEFTIIPAIQAYAAQCPERLAVGITEQLTVNGLDYVVSIMPMEPSQCSVNPCDWEEV